MSSGLAAGSVPDPFDPDLRVAVLGCGSIGRRHAENLRRIGVTALAFYDPDGATRAAAARALDGRAFATLEEVWSWEPEAVVVSAPTADHVTLALEAARHGCHLLIEKPLSHALSGTEDLQEEVRRRDLVTLVGCNMRFHPGPSRVKRLLDEGRIGDVLSARVQSGSYLPGWRPSSDYRSSYSASPDSGGAILDVIHELDLALWYLGSAELVAAARVRAESIGLRTDGLAEILLRHESGALSSVHLNYVQRDYRRGCQIIGSRGTIYWDLAEGVVRLLGPDGAEAERWSDGDQREAMDLMYVAEMEHFVKSVAAGAATVNPVSEATRTLRLALAARTWTEGAAGAH